MQRFALHDALGAIRQVHVGAAGLLQLAGEAVGHAGEDGAAQNEQLAGPHLLQQFRHGAVELDDGRVEVFIDGCADGDDDGGGVFEDGGIGGRADEAGLERFG